MDVQTSLKLKVVGGNLRPVPTLPKRYETPVRENLTKRNGVTMLTIYVKSQVLKYSDITSVISEVMEEYKREEEDQEEGQTKHFMS